MSILDNSIIFHSTSHLRFESGQPVRGLQHCNRSVEIKPNVNGCSGYSIKAGDGYIVTIYNLDGNHPILGNNVQMTPKPMRIVQQNNDKIVLRGYPCKAMGPFGWIDFDGSDYGLTVHMDGNTINKCTLHMYDRNVDLEYYK